MQTKTIEVSHDKHEIMGMRPPKKRPHAKYPHSIKTHCLTPMVQGSANFGAAKTQATNSNEIKVEVHYRKSRNQSKGYNEHVDRTNKFSLHKR